MSVIYVIDDDASICMAVARLMKSAGLLVRTFASAEAFLSSVQPTQSDCLLVDIQLPGMSGLELQRELKKIGRHVPIIFITAYDDDQVREQARRGGAVGYFSKPFDDKALLDAIRFAVARTGT